MTDHAADPEVLEDGEVGKDSLLLGHVGDAPGGGLVGGESGDVLALQADRPAHEGEQASQRRQQRRLAGAVRPEHGEDLACPR